MQDHLQIQFVPIAIFHIICWAHMNILFIIKVKLSLIKWSYSIGPQSSWLLSLEWLTSLPI